MAVDYTDCFIATPLYYLYTTLELSLVRIQQLYSMHHAQTILWEERMACSVTEGAHWCAYLGIISTLRSMNFSRTEAYMRSSTVARCSLLRTSCMRLWHTTAVCCDWWILYKQRHETGRARLFVAECCVSLCKHSAFCCGCWVLYRMCPRSTFNDALRD